LVAAVKVAVAAAPATVLVMVTGVPAAGYPSPNPREPVSEMAFPSVVAGTLFKAMDATLAERASLTWPVAAARVRSRHSCRHPGYDHKAS
jgi:hypothetical protein